MAKNSSHVSDNICSGTSGRVKAKKVRVLFLKQNPSECGQRSAWRRPRPSAISQPRCWFLTRFFPSKVSHGFPLKRLSLRDCGKVLASVWSQKKAFLRLLCCFSLKMSQKLILLVLQCFAQHLPRGCPLPNPITFHTRSICTMLCLRSMQFQGSIVAKYMPKSTLQLFGARPPGSNPAA